MFDQRRTDDRFKKGFMCRGRFITCFFAVDSFLPNQQVERAKESCEGTSGNDQPRSARNMETSVHLYFGEVRQVGGEGGPILSEIKPWRAKEIVASERKRDAQS